MARAGRILTRQQRCIVFEQGAETPCAGSQQDQKRPSDFVDPISRAPLFRTGTDANCGANTGSRGFFQPVAVSVPAARPQVLGIHLGHVFDNGRPPTGKRYCINGNLLAILPDRAPPPPLVDADHIAEVVCAARNDEHQIGQFHELAWPRLLARAEVATEFGADAVSPADRGALCR